MIQNIYSDRQRIRAAATKRYCDQTECPFRVGDRVYSSMWTAANPARREFEVTRITRRTMMIVDRTGNEFHAHAGFSYNNLTGEIEERWLFRMWDFQHEVHKV